MFLLPAENERVPYGVSSRSHRDLQGRGCGTCLAGASLRRECLGPRHGVESAIVAPHPEELLRVSPAFENSFSVGPGYARAQGGRTGGAGSCASDSSGWRTSSPLPALCCLINRSPNRNVGAHVGCAGLHPTSPLRTDIRSLRNLIGLLA